MNILLILTLLSQYNAGAYTSEPSLDIDQPVLSVTGQGTASADIQTSEYDIILYADTYSEDEDETIEKAEEMRKEIISVTKKIGGKEKDVVLTNRNTLEPIEGDPYFRVEQDIQIKLKKVKDINKIKETYLLIEGVQIGSVTPIMDKDADYGPALKNARSTAIKNAKQEAVDLAAEIGVLLGDPVFIAEDIVYPTYSGYETSEQTEVVVYITIYFSMTPKK
jgi:uncharacterized protein YggE